MAKVETSVRIFDFDSATQGSPFEVNRSSLVLKRSRNDTSYEEHGFGFDYVWTAEDTPQHMYQEACQPIAPTLLRGENACVCVYGTNESEKDYVLFGDTSLPTQRGIVPRVVVDLFAQLAQQQESSSDTITAVLCSYVSIEGEVITDLLKPENKSLRLRQHPQHGTFIENMTKILLHSPNDLPKVFDLQRRNAQLSQQQQYGSSGSSNSSRAHKIFTLHVGVASINNLSNSMTNSKFDAVLLASGAHFRAPTSLRASSIYTSNDASRAEVNRSLSSLIGIFTAMRNNSRPPYRDSLLTRTLQSSLQPNNPILLVACLHPGRMFEENLSVLNFVKSVKPIPYKLELGTPEPGLLDHVHDEVQDVLQSIARSRASPSPQRALHFGNGMQTVQDVPAGNHHEHAIAYPNSVEQEGNRYTGDEEEEEEEEDDVDTFITRAPTRVVDPEDRLHQALTQVYFPDLNLTDHPSDDQPAQSQQQQQQQQQQQEQQRRRRRTSTNTAATSSSTTGKFSARVLEKLQRSLHRDIDACIQLLANENSSVLDFTAQLYRKVGSLLRISRDLFHTESVEDERALAILAQIEAGFDSEDVRNYLELYAAQIRNDKHLQTSETLHQHRQQPQQVIEQLISELVQLSVQQRKADLETSALRRVFAQVASSLGFSGNTPSFLQPHNPTDTDKTNFLDVNDVYQTALQSEVDGLNEVVRFQNETISMLKKENLQLKQRLSGKRQAVSPGRNRTVMPSISGSNRLAVPSSGNGIDGSPQQQQQQQQQTSFMQINQQKKFGSNAAFLHPQPARNGHLPNSSSSNNSVNGSFSSVSAATAVRESNRVGGGGNNNSNNNNKLPALTSQSHSPPRSTHSPKLLSHPQQLIKPMRQAVPNTRNSQQQHQQHHHSKNNNGRPARLTHPHRVHTQRKPHTDPTAGDTSSQLPAITQHKPNPSSTSTVIHPSSPVSAATASAAVAAPPPSVTTVTSTATTATTATALAPHVSFTEETEDVHNVIERVPTPAPDFKHFEGAEILVIHDADGYSSSGDVSPTTLSPRATDVVAQARARAQTLSHTPAPAPPVDVMQDLIENHLPAVAGENDTSDEQQSAAGRSQSTDAYDTYPDADQDELDVPTPAAAVDEVPSQPSTPVSRYTAQHETAAVHIQRIYRGASTRQVTQQLQRETNAATVIQRHARGYMARHQGGTEVEQNSSNNNNSNNEEEEEEEEEEEVTEVQPQSQSKHHNPLDQMYYGSDQQAAVTVQRYTRGYLVRKHHPEVTHTMSPRVLSMKFVPDHLNDEEEQQKQQSDNADDDNNVADENAVTGDEEEEDGYDQYSPSQEVMNAVTTALDIDQTSTNAAVTIQTCYRGHRVRKQRSDAVQTIQRYYRGHTVRQQHPAAPPPAPTATETRTVPAPPTSRDGNEAATRIQAQYRRRLAQQQYHQLRQQHEAQQQETKPTDQIAAVKIQSRYRTHRAQQQYQQVVHERNAAAAKIQRQYKTYRSQQQVNEDAAAAKVQRQYRVHRRRKQMATHSHSRNRADTVSEASELEDLEEVDTNVSEDESTPAPVPATAPDTEPDSSSSGGGGGGGPHHENISASLIQRQWRAHYFRTHTVSITTPLHSMQHR